MRGRGRPGRPLAPSPARTAEALDESKKCDAAAPAGGPAPALKRAVADAERDLRDLESTVTMVERQRQRFSHIDDVRSPVPRPAAAVPSPACARVTRPPGATLAPAATLQAELDRRKGYVSDMRAVRGPLRRLFSRHVPRCAGHGGLELAVTSLPSRAPPRRLWAACPARWSLRPQRRRSSRWRRRRRARWRPDPHAMPAIVAADALLCRRCALQRTGAASSGRTEYEQRHGEFIGRARQQQEVLREQETEHLEDIERGLSRLGEAATAINYELKDQGECVRTRRRPCARVEAVAAWVQCGKDPSLTRAPSAQDAR